MACTGKMQSSRSLCILRGCYRAEKEGAGRAMGVGGRKGEARGGEGARRPWDRGIEPLEVIGLTLSWPATVLGKQTKQQWAVKHPGVVTGNKMLPWPGHLVQMGDDRKQGMLGRRLTVWWPMPRCWRKQKETQRGPWSA